MATKPENTFRASVHKYLPSKLHHEKMNNPYSSGTADDWFSGNRADLWVEYKFLSKIPKVIYLTNPDVKQPMLSKLQEMWLRGRYEEGRNVCVIIGCPDGGMVVKHLAWEQPITCTEFREHLISRKDIATQIALLTMK